MTVAPMTLTDDRRHKRSGDPLVALHYQLAHVRSEGRLEAIVVADGAGVMVAGAGGWALCEELAAYAPLLAREGWVEPGAAHPSRLAEIRARADVKTVEVAGHDVLLCAIGGGTRRTAIEKAERGVVRILSGNP